MVKRLRFQEDRNASRRRKRPPGERWVFEPLDAVIAAFTGALVLWLQWLLASLPN